MRTRNGRDSASEILEPIWLTSRQTQQRLNISDATLKRLGILDVLTPLRFCREKRYKRTEVEAFTQLGQEKLSAITEQLAKLSRLNKAKAARNGS